MKKQWYVLSLIGAAIVGARWSELSVNHGPLATSPESISKPVAALPATAPITPTELPIAPPMTEEDRNKLFAALRQHADPQTAPVQEQAEAAAAAPDVLQSAPGASPVSPRPATPAQQAAAKDKVAAAKPRKDPGPSPSVTPACDAPSPNTIRDAVRKKIRNPDTAQFGAAAVLCGDQFDGTPTKIICGSVNTKNMFGEYEGNASYVIVVESGLVEVPASAEVWNKYCGGSYRSTVTLPESMMQSS